MAAIYDKNGSLLTFTGQIPQVSPSFFEENAGLSNKKIFMQEARNNLQFLAPVISRTVNPKEANLDKLYSEKDQKIGWVVITLSRENTKVTQYQAIIATLLIVLIGLTVSILFGLRLSGDLINPLFDIINAVKRIKEGTLDTKLDGKSPGELKNLEDGINSMALSLANSHEEMQRNIKRATRELRHTLQTVERQNVQLDVARKEAVEASEIKSKFLANMSHEIRTPMNGILGFLDLLAKSELNSLQKEYLETIALSSKNLLSIINDILDFSKIESGSLLLENNVFNLHEEIYNCIMLFKPKIIEQQIDFGLKLDPDLPQMVVGDALRFCQILTNLVGNALKFTEKGGVKVEVSLKEITVEKVELIVLVTDTGIGLSKTQIEKLFNAFTQADLSTSRKYGGTGLGLTISKTLIEKMGGQISVVSEPNQGARFSFSVIFNKEPDTQTLAYPRISAPQLIIYDKTHYAGEMLISDLKTCGVRCLICVTETSLIDMVVENPDIDIVMVFNELPDKQKLKQSLIMDLNSFSNANLFLVANSSWNELVEYCQQLGIKNGLNYPYKLHKLTSFLSSSFENISLVEASMTSSSESIANPQAILIVDDNPINLKLLHILLEQKGHKPVDAFSAKEALLLAHEHNFTMILTDVHMPEMDGIELCHELRKNPKYQHIPIIAVTADVVEGQSNALLQEGFDAIQIKPISDMELSELLAHYLNSMSDQRPISNMEASYQKPENTEMLKLIDLEFGASLAGGNMKFAKEMLSAFMDTLTQAIKDIMKAYERNEGKALCERVHKLHGGASYCGVPLLKDTLCLLEKALHHSDFVINVVVLEKYKQFLEVCDKTMQAYQQQYNEGVE